jgi:hypothetical protein
VGTASTGTPSVTSTPSVGGGGFTVVSASMTYSADDYFKFWINGNQVVNGSVLDAGAPPVTVAIPAADFNAGGAPNYFAAANLNVVADIVGSTWLVTLTGADGTMAYVTAGDSSWTLYDDLTGTAPPPVNGGFSWYQPAWVDAGSLFSETPIDTNGITWFSPPHLTNPGTGAQIPVLSHSVSGTQSSNSEVLYYRESVVLVGIPATATPTGTASPTASATGTSGGGSPTPSVTSTPTSTVTPSPSDTPSYTPGEGSSTPTPTAIGTPPTPIPTVCGAAPAFVESAVLANTGCAGNGNPVGWVYTVPANPGEIMLVQVESTGPVITSVTWNGVALKALPGSPHAGLEGGKIYTYYRVDPEPGTFEINFPGAVGCSWNPTVSVYKNIDTADPFGAIHSSSGSGEDAVIDTITTTSPNSLIHDFYTYLDGPFPYGAITGTQLWAANTSNCCDAVYGSFLNTTSAGPYTLRYPDTIGPNQWAAETIELKAAACAPTPTPLTTLPPVADPQPGVMFTYPQPCRSPVLHFAYFMRGPGQAHLHLFNAAGLALGSLDEHREAGPQVGNLQVGSFASGVYYFQMEIRYDAGDREMLKAGKFLVLRP